MRSERKLKVIAGGLPGVGGGDVDAALALGAQLVGDDGEPGLLGELDVGRHQEGLHGEHGVGAVEALARPEEAAQGGGGVAQEALALGDVEEALPQAGDAAGTLVEGDAVAADAPFQARRPVVAQVLADAGEVVVDLDAELLEAGGLADAGELQQLGRGDGTGRHDHLAGGARLALLAADGIAHADAAAAFQDQALGGGVGLDGEVLAQARGLEVAARRAHAPAAADRALRHGDAFLVGAVVVAVGLQADALGGGEEAVVQPAAVAEVGDLDGPVAAAQVAVAGFVALHRLEDRQHVLPAPAAVAELGPVVVVLALAAHPHHAVDGAGAAEHAPARHGDGAPSGVGLGLGGIEPVDAGAVDELGEADGHAREGMGLAAGFQQQHLVAPVSVRRLASAAPADPAPMTMKSTVNGSMRFLVPGVLVG